MSTFDTNRRFFGALLRARRPLYTLQVLDNQALAKGMRGICAVSVSGRGCDLENFFLLFLALSERYCYCYNTNTVNEITVVSRDVILLKNRRTIHNTL